MAFIDLKDAYYSVRVAKTDRKYLRFLWNDKLYQYTCMPNGLSCAPRKFTKLLKPPLAKLHCMGHVVLGCIDDFYLQGNSYYECLNNVIDTCNILDSLGFYIHLEKSAFQPSQQLVFLGFNNNSVTMSITLTEEKASKLESLCISLRNNTQPTVRNTAQVIGTIISSFLAQDSGLFISARSKEIKQRHLRLTKGILIVV